MHNFSQDMHHICLQNFSGCVSDKLQNPDIIDRDLFGFVVSWLPIVTCVNNHCDTRSASPRFDINQMSSLADSLYLDSVRNPESSCADLDDSDSDRVVNQSPDLQESSNDEYTGTPTKQNTITVYSTPTSRSEPNSSLSPRARKKLKKLCHKIYGGCLCLVTMRDSALILEIAHVIQRRSKSDDVNSSISYEIRDANISSVYAL
jgi:hypothetical protein